MGIDGMWWPLEDDEPFSLEHGSIYELRGDAVIDTRSGERLGECVQHATGIDLLFAQRDGDRPVWHIRMAPCCQESGGTFLLVYPPFDPDADSFTVKYTGERYEAYRAARPANDFETDEEMDARSDWEADEFHIMPRYGYLYRDCDDIRELARKNDHETAVRLRREAMSVVG